MVNENFSNGLTPAQAERLALLAEECGEAVQVIGKILRHGLYSSNPLLGGGIANDAALAKEVGDIIAAVKLLCDAGVLRAVDIEHATADKLARVERWLHHTTAVAP